MGDNNISRSFEPSPVYFVLLHHQLVLDVPVTFDTSITRWCVILTTLRVVFVCFGTSMSRLSIPIANVILLVVACQTNSPWNSLVSALGLLLSIFLVILGQVQFTNDYCTPDTSPEPGPPSNVTQAQGNTHIYIY